MEPWKALVIQSLEELSDLDFQLKVWVRGESGMVSSPVEAICGLFDDSGLGTAMKDGIVFSPKADRSINEFHEYFKTLNLKQPYMALISSEKWSKSVHLAKRALEDVMAVLNSK